MPTIVQNLRGFLSSSFLALPLILYGWSFFLGLTTGNIGLLILSIGGATLVPLVTWFTHTILDLILNLVSYGSLFESGIKESVIKNLKKTPGLNFSKAIESRLLTKDVYKSFFATEDCKACSVLQTGEGCEDDLSYIFPSYWMAEVAFFFFFVITNAAAIKDMKEDEGASKEKVDKRKDQANLVLTIASILFIILTAVRYFILGCETITGILYATAVFGSLAAAWYSVAKSCSMRDSDLFGIVTGILPPNINDQGPMTCVYQG